MTRIAAKKKNKAHLIPLLALSCLLFFISAYAIYDGSPFDGWQLTIAGLQIAWIAIYIIASTGYARSPYLFTTAYLTVLLLFHLGLFLQYALGIENIPEWDGVQQPWVYLAACHTLLATTSLGIGFSLFLLFSRKRPTPPLPASQALAMQVIGKTRSIGFGLLLASAILLVAAIITLGNILAFSRFELFYGKHDTRFIGVFTMIFPTAILILLVTARNRAQKQLGLMLGLFAFLFLMLSGYRSIALFPALTGGVVWAKMNRKIPIPLVVGGVIFVLLAIPVVGYMRSIGSYENLSMETITKSAQQASVQRAVSELGRTFGILAKTLEEIPKQESFRNGKPYLNYIKSAIPNIGSKLSEEGSRAVALRKIRDHKDEGLMELSPSDWATYQIIPEQFLIGGGTGFSAIAEAYFNFGSIGVVVNFFVFGLLLAKLDSVDITTNSKAMLFATLFFWQFLATVRNEFGVFIKPVVFTSIIAIIWVMATSFFPSAKKSTRVAAR